MAKALAKPNTVKWHNLWLFSVPNITLIKGNYMYIAKFMAILTSQLYSGLQLTVCLTCAEDIELFNDHPSTSAHLTRLINKP